jgi:3-oxoacyl-[acyl-carrier protein] reductase
MAITHRRSFYGRIVHYFATLAYERSVHIISGEETMSRTTDRVAIVTGGSGGIGKISAERLASDGLAVVVHYAGNQSRAEETVAGIISNGGRAIAAGGDIADETDMAAVFDAAEKEFGGVDVLVHTAGIMPLSPIAQLDLDVFDRVQRTNVRGTFVVDQLAAQRMRGGGAIINFSPADPRLWRVRSVQGSSRGDLPDPRS